MPTYWHISRFADLARRRVLRGSVDDFADEVDRETHEPADHRAVDANELKIGPEQDLELA